MPVLHPDSDYLLLNLPEANREPNAKAPAIAGVHERFSRIATHGDHLSASETGVFVPPKRHLRYTWIEANNLNVGKNHFQGVQRRGRYLFITGGDSTESRGHLFILRMDSRRERGAWGSNVLLDAQAPASDGLIRVVALDRTKWHAGGLSLLDDLIAIPLEGDEKKKRGTRIAFLDVSDPEEPRRYTSVEIERTKVHKAGAVALSRLADGRYITAVFFDDKTHKPPGRIDLFFSKTAQFLDGFAHHEAPVIVRVPELFDARRPSYQAIALVRTDSAPDAAAGQQRYYLIGTENESSAAPFVNGANRADLFTLDVIPPAPGAPHTDAVTTVHFVETLDFRCGRENGNFDAAAGIHFDDDGILSIYTAYHWRFNNEFRLAEFHGRQSPDDACAALEHSWIEIFEGPNFRGRGLTLHASGQTELEDYSRLFVQGGDFDDIASSVRFRLPPGARYRLYREGGYQGDFLDLAGDGRIQEIADLHAPPHQFGDRIRSSRFVS